MLASGPDDALDTCRPLFDAVAQRTMRLGAAGTGTRLKLAVNLWVLVVTQGTAETIAFAQSLGLRSGRGSSARSRAARWTCPTSA